MSPELRDLCYESRLLQCGLATLETRRLRGDQIEVYKIVMVMRMLTGICSSNLKKAVEPEDIKQH